MFDIILCIILDLQIKIVENVGFKRLFTNCFPKIDIPTRKTVKFHVNKLFLIV